MVEKEIKKRYQWTELGTVPEDWEVEMILKNVDVTMGQSPLGETYNKSKGVPLLNGPTEFGLVNPVPIQYTTKPTKLSEIGDILLCVRGSTTGRLNLSDQRYCIGRGLASIRGKLGKTDTKWLYYQFIKLQNYILHVASGGGSTFPNINQDVIKAIFLPFPSLPEQQKISHVLSDIDELIRHQNKIIEKKKDIKKGSMQELLTGKRRLKGFKEKWDVERLGNLLDYEQPTKYLVKDEKYDSDFSTPVLTAGKTFVLGFTNEKTGIFQNLPVIIFDDFTTASKYVAFPFKAKSSAMKMLKSKNENVNLEFIYERMQLINFSLGDHKRYWLSEYQNLEIEIPKKDEQDAMAKILSDMDSEIKELEKERDKYIMIKNGMMQKLFTGEIRLN